MRPAGAIAPFDADGPNLRLSWEAGPEARFYRALAAAWETGTRRPDRFDWPRFRDLLRDGNIPPELRADPWLADWDEAAIRTAQSGFDRRRIQPRPRTPVTLSVPWPGPWAGSSPFTETYLWEPGDTVTIEAAAEADTLVSPSGVLRYSQTGVVRIPRGP
jgi:hypothetical protein